MFAASKSGRSAAGGGGTTDQYFPYVPLLLKTTSTNGQNNQGTTTTNGFLDSSTNAFPITRNGTPTQGSSTPYWPDGQWSNNFNGSSNLSVASNAALAMGSGDFTVEFWVYLRATTNDRTLSWPVVGNMAINCAPSGYWNYANYGVGNILTSSIITPLNTWTHVAISRTGTTTRIFINGVQGAITTVDANNWGQSVLNIGSDIASNFFNGYMSNLRIVKGVGVYTGAFTPPTTPLQKTQAGNGGTIQAITGTQTSLLTCQSNRFVNNSDISLTLTVANGTPTVQAFQPFSPTASYTTALYGGSGYFNGSADYLSAASNAAFDLGANNFTIEAWIQTTSSVQYTTIAARQIASATGNWWFLINNASSTAGDVAFWCYDYNSFSTQMIVTTGASVRDGAWHHVALVRNGSAWAIYIDGVSRGTQTSSITIGTLSAAVYVGNNQQNSTKYFPGYISNFRMVNGAAVYTGTPFTPPTLAPLTTAGSTSAASYSSTTNVNTSFAASSTSLLLNMTNAGIYDAAAQNNVTTVGDAQASTTQSKWSPTSMKFDGTGDYLDLSNINPALNLGSSNWTIEFWAYTASTSPGTLLFLQGNASAYAAVRLQVASNQFAIFMSTTGSSWAINQDPAGSIPLSTWTYVAMTRSGTTFTLYVNGTSAYTSTALGTSSLMTGTNNYIGAFSGSPFYYLNGYLQDFRITRGVARTITTPTAAFPTR
jgi:hypothetical protein